MNRADLISEIAELTGQPKSEVGTTLTAIIHSVTSALSKGDKVTLVGFGTFERRNRQARTGRNPRTLAPLRIPSSRVPAFRAGQELKEHSRRTSTPQIMGCTRNQGNPEEEEDHYQQGRQKQKALVS